MSENQHIRKGLKSDQEWLFDLFKATMKDYIEHAWGWDEQIQREGFKTALPWQNFRILIAENENLGGFHVSDKNEILVLDMILLHPEYHRKGWGTFMMNLVKGEAMAKNVALELNVLHTNPALEFHKSSGFEEISRDEKSIRMRWKSS